jgi:hypothetical protein
LLWAVAAFEDRDSIVDESVEGGPDWAGSCSAGMHGAATSEITKININNKRFK